MLSDLLLQLATGSDLWTILSLCGFQQVSHSLLLVVPTEVKVQPCAQCELRLFALHSSVLVLMQLCNANARYISANRTGEVCFG